MSGVQCRHLYKGRIFDIWAAWHPSKPENYSLGRSEKEARTAFEAQPVVEFTPDSITGGMWATTAAFPLLKGVGGSTITAEKALMRQINAELGKPNWQDLCMELVLAAAGTFDWDVEMPWSAREIELIRKEINRRRVAERFSGASGGASGEPSGGGEFDANEPFCGD